MTPWVLLWLYIAGIPAMWVFTVRALHRYHRRRYAILDWGRGDDIFAFFWGFGVALLWPIFAPCYALSQLAPKVMDRVIGPR